jgi:hypothetical protein
MTQLFKIDGGKLIKAQSRPLLKEELIEDWVFSDPGLVGLDAIVIGRQVQTAQNKHIDLLLLDQLGDLVIIELKKDKTPREIVAQVLDYASWVRTLTTREVLDLAERYRRESLTKLYRDHFEDEIPENLNDSHSMLIVASELDPESRRIVEYLSEEHGVGINTVFFNVFEDREEQWLTTDFLLDQEEVEVRKRKRPPRPPWTGFYFVNGGDHPYWRSWQDMVEYGFISAGGGSVFSKQLDRLDIGDKVFVFQKGKGYVGYGVVASTKVPAAEFETENGMRLERDLKVPNMRERANDPERAEYAVGVKWYKTFDLKHAKRFKGIFANPSIVCKLYDEETVKYLKQEFGIEDESLVR